MSDLSLSDRLMTLVFDAVQEAELALSDGQALTVFVLLLTREGVILQRFDGESVRARLQKARADIAQRNDDTRAYVLVYDAVVTVNEEEVDAVMVEAGERDAAHGWRFVQRYHPHTAETPYRRIGQVAYLGITDLYWDTSS